jgi:hypothetical protein
MPDRPKVMIHKKRVTLVLQVGGLAWGLKPHPVKNALNAEKHSTTAAGREHLNRPSKIMDL